METENGNNPLSSWVRPVIAFLAFGVFAGLSWIVIKHILNTGGNIELVVAIMVIFAGCFLWYYNVRSQDKILEKFSNLTGILANTIQKNGGVGSAEPPLASNVGNSITNDTTIEPESDTTIEPEEEEIIIPFDKENFIKEVAETDPVQDYAVDTATARFYESRDRILVRWLNDGRIQNNQALLDAWRTIKDYAEKSFREIWEIMDDTVPPLVWVDQNYDELKKCTTCKAPSTFKDLEWLAQMKDGKYYVSYLKLMDTYDNVNTWADDVHQRGIKEL